MFEEIQSWSKKLKDGLDIAHNFHFQNSAKLPTNIKKIAFFGMGGSGIAGRIVKTFLDKKSKIPSFIIDGPQVPEFIDTDTLCIVISYSGNTWETIQALNNLTENFIPTLIMSHDGKALEISESKNIPFILLPTSSQPRAALGNFLGIILGLFDLMKILPDGEETVKKFIEQAELSITKFNDESYFNDFLDNAINYETFHVWGISGDSAAFAYRGQTQFNENSKVRAVFSDFPECCHNLLVGFTNSNENSFVVMFYSEFLNSNLIASIQATAEILKEQGAVLYKVPILGDNWEEQLFNMIIWADFASYYLGKKRGVEIAPVKLIDQLKEKHKSKGIK
ncbi:SIS domain-containing protein [Candidatus Dependentiae bacterium]|nr:SIS domain-containing protein [Candidatus Dependentiae bacterium]